MCSYPSKRKHDFQPNGCRPERFLRPFSPCLDKAHWPYTCTTQVEGYQGFTAASAVTSGAPPSAAISLRRFLSSFLVPILLCFSSPREMRSERQNAFIFVFGFRGVIWFWICGFELVFLINFGCKDLGAKRRKPICRAKVPDDWRSLH